MLNHALTAEATELQERAVAEKERSKATSASPRMTQALCGGKCSVETKHEVLKSVQVDNDSEDKSMTTWEEYLTLRCRGCETPSFRYTYRCSAEVDPNTGKMGEYSEQFYPVLRGAFDPWVLPPKVSAVYRETIRALLGQQPILAGIGIRALVEAVCSEAKCEGNNLLRRIDDLVTRGKLTRDGADHLQRLRVLGNAAAHEVEAPSRDVLKVAMDVAKHLLESVYVIPKKAAQLPTVDS